MNKRQRDEAKLLSLREFFERHFAANFLIGARPKTHRAYGEMLDHWERLTHDPRLCDIDNETLAAFKASLRDPESFRRKAGRPNPQLTLFDMPPRRRRGRPTKALSRASVNKQLRHLHAVLAKASRPGPGQRDALGILPVMPWTKPLREYRRLPRNVRDDTLAAIYGACDSARYPRLPGVRPGDWWKALIVAALTIGFRRGGLLRLRWAEIYWEDREIRLAAEDDKCWSERCKPLTEMLIKHLLRIRHGRPRVFAFPSSDSSFYRTWREIQDAAGVQPRIRLHDLKGAGGTRLARVGSLWTVKEHMDHGALQTSTWYINASDEQRAAVEKMPLPDVFFKEFGDQPPAGSGVG